MDDLLPGMGDAVTGTVTAHVLGRSTPAEQGVRGRLQENNDGMARISWRSALMTACT
jgi:hypothetical protein